MPKRSFLAQEPTCSPIAPTPAPAVQEIELSIVMPCLNEAETILACITKARNFLARSGVSGEIVIGDNGSNDGSQDIARACGARVVDIPTRGYGAALSGAMQAARGQYIIMGDCDCSYDFEALDGFLDKLRTGCELVMGDRFAGGISPGAMPWKNRYIGNPILSGVGRLFFNSPIRDFHCGLRGLSKQAFLAMDLRTTGMEFASEMVIKATLFGMRVGEVPTTLAVDGRSRPPHLRPFRDGWRHLRFMLLFNQNLLFLYPGLLLLSLGLAGGAALSAGPATIFGLRFSLDTLVYCSAMIAVGAQAVLFAILSRNYAVQEGLMPPLQRDRLLLSIQMEHGLVIGVLLVICGFGLANDALRTWRDAQFGLMDFESISRVTIFSALGLSLGSEIIFSSFLLSTIRLSVAANSTSASSRGLSALGGKALGGKTLGEDASK